MNFEDKKVWQDMITSPIGIFQFESEFAFNLLKEYKPTKIHDLSLVNAIVRPSGASFRDKLVAHEVNKNPSKLIDDLLADNNGFLCIEENQLVSTVNNGLVPIKDICVGDKVYTCNSVSIVNKVMDNRNKEVYKLTTPSKELICTDNHKILTENGWKEYKDIEVGECICTSIKNNIHYESVISKKYVGIRHVYDLEIDKEHNFIVNGIVVHNCFQEDTIAFLKDICGLSGSEADNVRRAIGRKKKDRLMEALPSILEGYCSKSDKPRDVAEEEAKKFLQIIEDSSDYQFGLNHATGYSVLGYYCAYYRYYYPLEFVTASLNNAKTDKDIYSGEQLAKLKNIKIKNALFRYSKGEYFFDKESNNIYKGIGSIKFLNKQVGEYLYTLKNINFDTFVDLLNTISYSNVVVNNRQLKILIEIGFFEEFGKTQKLLDVLKLFDKYNGRKQIDKDLIVFDLNLLRRFAVKETNKKFILNNNMINLLKAKEKEIPNEEMDIRERIIDVFKYTGDCNIKDSTAPKTECLVLDINTKYSPKLKLYCIRTGKTFDAKINKKIYNNAKIKKEDLIIVKEMEKKRKTAKVGNEFKKVKGYDYWILSYFKIIK